jgi:hypothetical protein
VLLGQRGARAARERRAAATAWLAAFAMLAAACGAAAIATAPSGGRAALTVPVALAVALAIVIVRGGEHTIAGEVLSALALSSIAYPIGVLSHASARASLTCAAAFAATFVVGVVCVHGVIGFTRHPPARRARAAGAVAAIGAVVLTASLASSRVLEIVAPWAIAPAVIAGLGLMQWPPSARRLRAVGWTLVATSTLTAAALLVVLR